MLGTRTKQVNSYGRRGSRIVNVSDRRDRESANSSEATSEVDIPLPPRPLRRENTIVISPARSQVEFRRLKGSSRSPLPCSPSTQTRNMQSKVTRNSVTKRIQSTVEPCTRVRKPLIPIRVNGTPPRSNEHSSSGVKARSRATIKPMRTSLRSHAPLIPVDIFVLDEDGNTLSQERRLSHTEIQTNRVGTATEKGKKTFRLPPTSPAPIVVSDDSDTEVVSPKPIAKRSSRRPHAIVISSADESEEDQKGESPLVSVKKRSRSKSRVEVVIPPAPYRESKISKRPSGPPPLALALPRTPLQPAPSFRPDSTTIPPLLAPPIPVAKQRQLTPIRGSSNRSLFRRPPPTPSTPTEADLSLDLAQLDLSGATEVDGLTFSQPEYLVPLLRECAQTSPYEFSAFIETFPFDPIVQSSVEDEDAKFRKIGEASYSEVFGIGDVVLKIIPIRLEEEPMYPGATETPAPTDAKDVLKEIIVTREIGEICDKFVKLLKTYIVKGKYPSLLLDLWDAYNNKKGSESIRPDSFGLMQIYAIIILPNGGPDLESFVFRNVSKCGWHQACGIFWQVARALEQAEHMVNFEHRDLHWGQVLVRNIPVKKTTNKGSVSRVAMDDIRFGVKVTIIDLGLSRMDATDVQGSEIYWTPFDEEIFEGEGDYQFDVYRMMRDHIGNAWKSYNPLTNVMWLHYLITKLLHEKRVKLPGGTRQTGEHRVMSPTGYDEQECHDCLTEMERLLCSCISSVRKGQKGRRKTVAPSSGLGSARDVIAYGIRRGWVR